MLLPGGDAAIKAPWRTAVSYLHSAFDGHLPELPFLKGLEVDQVSEMVAQGQICFRYNLTHHKVYFPSRRGVLLK